MSCITYALNDISTSICPRINDMQPMRNAWLTFNVRDNLDGWCRYALVDPRDNSAKPTSPLGTGLKMTSYATTPTLPPPPKPFLNYLLAPWLQMAQFFHSGANAFAAAQITSPQPLLPTAQPSSMVVTSPTQVPVTSTAANASSQFSHSAIGVVNAPPITIVHSPKGGRPQPMAVNPPVMFPPSTPGYFLYPAGVSGELHALPLAPINAVGVAAGAAMAPHGAPLVGNPAFGGGSPRPLFPLLTPQPKTNLHEHQPVTMKNEEGGFRRPRALTGKTPTASGFYPAHMDANNPLHYRPVSVKHPNLPSAECTAMPVVYLILCSPCWIAQSFTRSQGLGWASIPKWYIKRLLGSLQALGLILGGRWEGVLRRLRIELAEPLSHHRVM